ncbi:MAG TPA: sugar ABC transporter permease [Arachnia sp.]|nr:sugar ABC transporter permease [Arachnia sp.]
MTGLTTPVASVGGRRRRADGGSPIRSRRRGRAMTKAVPYILLAPFIILFIVFFISPIVYAAYLSVFVDRVVGGQSFVGLENYARVLTDPLFLSGVGRVLLYGIVVVPVTLLLALALALLIDRERLRGRAFLQLAYFLPFAIPSVISALLWGYMYGNSFGVFTQIARALDLPDPNLLSADNILFSIGNIAVWAAAGANMIIFYSALRSIPRELFEAARLDGASEWKIAWHVKIPLLRSTMIFTAVLAIIGALQLFNEPTVLKPNALGAITNYFTPNMYAFNLIATSQQYNLAAAVAFTLTALIVGLTAIFLLLTRRRSAA